MSTRFTDKQGNNRERLYAEHDAANAHHRFLRLPRVCDRTGYARATIYRLMAAGEFPKPYSLGARAVAWLEREVDEWIAARIAAAKSAQPQSLLRAANQVVHQ